MVQLYVREQRAKAGGEVMFSVSDIKEDVYPQSTGEERNYMRRGVLDFAYDIYLEHDLPVARCERRYVGRNRAATG